MKDAEKLFAKISEELSPKHKGDIVAIEMESGEYFLGESELEAYKKAVKKFPGKKFLFKKIGFPSTHFVGAL